MTKILKWIVIAMTAVVVIISDRAVKASTSAVCTAFCPGGNPILSGTAVPVNAEIVPIFWGPWPSGQPTGPQVLGAAEAILNGPHWGALAQYGVNQPRLSAMGAIYTAQPPPANNFANSVIPTMINTEIAAGRVPAPNSGADMFYVVFLPANLQGCGNGVCGPGLNAAGTYLGTGYKWAYVSGTSAATGFASYSEVFTHEVDEGMTRAFTVSNCGANSNQISDICECLAEDQQQGTMTVQGYWSQVDGKCVLPEAWNGLFQYTGTPNVWTQIANFPVRQVAAGAYGIVTTDTNDNEWLFTPALNQFIEIGGPVADFAVGSDGIVALPPDLSLVARYNGSWSAIGGPGAMMVYASSFQTVGSGGSSFEFMTTDWNGNPFLFDSSSSTWSSIGGPGDQFVLTTSFVAGLTPNHLNLNLWDHGTTWSTIAGGASQIFGSSSNNVIGGITLDSAKQVQTWSAGFSGWRTLGGPGSSFGLAGSGSPVLAGVTLNHGQINQSSNVSTTGLPWTKIRGASGRIVSGGQSFVATGAVTY